MRNILISLNTINKCDLYIIFWCIVQIEEVIHITGVISQGIQALLLCWALYEGTLYFIPDKRHPFLLKATSILTLMFTVYGLIFVITSPPFFDKDPHYVYMKSFWVSFFPLFMFYKYAKEGYLTAERIKVYLFIFLVTVTLQYFHLHSYLSSVSGKEEVTNNNGYLFLQLFPYSFFLYKKRTLQYVIVGILSLFILLSMKRGAIAICAICFIWFLWDSIKKSTSLKHKYITIFFGTILTITAFSAITYLLATNEYLNQRIEQTEKGGSSGRDKLYSTLIDVIVNDDSYIHLFFGNGAYKTIELLHKPAHNDWLETACNNGFIGIVCFVLFLYSFYRTAKLSKRVLRPEITSVLLMMFFIFFSQTLFSMALQKLPIYITIMMAYITSQVNSYEHEGYC